MRHEIIEAEAADAEPLPIGEVLRGLRPLAPGDAAAPVAPPLHASSGRRPDVMWLVWL